ncbi:Crp/Fnr family transcriptional regulator [Chitinophaga sp. Cy-1792]|uniref:Crp/Fnr family transcriptional regulator n=1 Tax=Chitinophaga sp. Cy-1792 TaxID=2608339 RepID=UPI0014232673|nr:Crp/Fnr family transcriptional regulator [Chitinophaga sp. Cy-1792]NIG57468.1 Crp/Fnr family transcriptional regulator [Chitinophaga sp. Cy-1792]
MSLTGIFPIDKWNFKSQSIFSNLPDEEYGLLCANKQEQTYEKGEIIFKEGGIPAGIYFIKHGKIKKYKADRDGREQIIYVANTGEMIGYHAILGEDRYPDSAAALEDCTLHFIPKEDFVAAMERSPILTQRLLKALSHEFAVLSNTISVFAQKSVKERLAIALIVLREKYKDDAVAGEPVQINISRTDLASIVGTAKENVVRFLKEFKEAGIVNSQGRKIQVLDINRLIEISNYTN